MNFRLLSCLLPLALLLSTSSADAQDRPPLATETRPAAEAPPSSSSEEAPAFFWARAGIGVGLGLTADKETYRSDGITKTVDDVSGKDLGLDLDFTAGAFLGPYVAFGGTLRSVILMGLPEHDGAANGLLLLGPDLTIFPFGDHRGPTLRLNPSTARAGDYIGSAFTTGLGYTFLFGRHSASFIGVHWTSAFLTSGEEGDHGVYQSRASLHHASLALTIQRR